MRIMIEAADYLWSRPEYVVGFRAENMWMSVVGLVGRTAFPTSEATVVIEWDLCEEEISTIEIAVREYALLNYRGTMEHRKSFFCTSQ